MIPTRIRAIAHDWHFDYGYDERDCSGDYHIVMCDVIGRLIQDAEQRAFRRAAEAAVGYETGMNAAIAIEDEAKEWAK